MFKEQLIQLMTENNINQRQLAIKTDIQIPTLNGWIARNRIPELFQIIKIANYFNVSIDYLVGRENDFGIVQSNANLSTKENELIGYFRKLREFEQGQLLGVARTLAKGI